MDVSASCLNKAHQYVEQSQVGWRGQMHTRHWGDGGGPWLWHTYTRVCATLRKRTGRLALL